MADDPRPFGMVGGRVWASVGDTADAGFAPDRIGVNGTAKFSANVQRVITTTPGAKAIDLPQAISASIVNGVLQWQGNNLVPLIANVDAAGKNLGWQWRVDFSNLTYTDPNTNTAQKVNLDGWPLDVKVWNQADASTVTDIADQAPVLNASPTLLAKGDPGPVAKLVKRNVTTTTDPTAADIILIPTADPTVTLVDFIYPIGTGGGGGGVGTVTKVASKAPDGTGNVTLAPSDIGAAAQSDLVTAQQTASNALQTATAAGSAAATAQSTATAAQSGLASKADSSAILGLAPLASPTFTGDPKAPTPATADNDTSIATTAFVRNAITAYAPTVSASVARAELVWDPTTQQWINDAGVAVTSRPNVKLVRLNGTTDPGATRPAWMGTGDQIIPHPDSPMAG